MPSSSITFGRSAASVIRFGATVERRTLANRVGLVQTVVALVALAPVALVTTLTVTAVLTRKKDEAPEQVSTPVAGVVQGASRSNATQAGRSVVTGSRHYLP